MLKSPMRARLEKIWISKELKTLNKVSMTMAGDEGGR